MNDSDFSRGFELDFSCGLRTHAGFDKIRLKKMKTLCKIKKARKKQEYLGKRYYVYLKILAFSNQMLCLLSLKPAHVCEVEG